MAVFLPRQAAPTAGRTAPLAAAQLPASVLPPARRACRSPACSALKSQTGAAEAFQPSRREAMALVLAGATLLPSLPAEAIQGLTAGRIPGQSKTPDANGFYTYTRPEGKSGGHGVGWSEIPQYTFKVPEGWGETPVSIADLGGTEIDLRYSSKEQGEAAVVVAPVLRFMDVGFNARISLKDVGEPDRVIAGFAPELFGKPLETEDILDTQVETDKNGQLYYYWTLKPHNLVAATAVKNRVFLITVTASGRQWKKFEPQLRAIQTSFKVPDDSL